MSTAVPFKGAVCATLCKPAVQRADIIPYRSHDGVFRALFLVAKAQINVLCLYRALLFKLHPARKPHRGRSGSDTVEQIGLGGCPQRKQSRQRVAAQNDFDVFRERKLLLQCGNDLLRQKTQGVPSVAAEALLSPHGRGFPRRKRIVPAFHRDSREQKILAALSNGRHFIIHTLQLMLTCHLEQQVFCISPAVNAARSVPDLHCLCGHCGILRSLLYLSLFAGWGISLYNRTVHPQVRRLLLNVDLLMLFWIIVRTLRFQLNTPPGMDRMLGYLYYAPMLGIPVLCVQLVLTVDRSERYRLSAWARMLWLPSAVLLELVLTNDLHQQVFRLQQPWNENYQYGWLFGLVVGWIVICILLAFGIIAHKSRNPRILRRLPLPAIPMVLLGVYAVLYGFHFPLIRQFLGDMTIVHCLMTAASLEGGLRCGLIQSNTGYVELLRVTSLAVQLVDRQGNVYCCSENGRMVDRRELQAAMHGTVQLDEHTLLRSAPVQGGYVMWQTDITELVENMERLKENRTELAERNYLEQQNYEVERKINALREKKRLYDLLQRQLAPQIIRMDQLLTRYRAAPEEEKRQLLGQVAVLGAYLKRGANLMFLAQQHRYVPSAELRYALEESISSLELAGVECAMEVTQGVRLPAEAAAACYSRFESVVEGALGRLDALFVRAIWKDHRLNLYLSVETGADLKASCLAAVQEAPGSWVLNDHFEGGAPECGTN